MRMKLTSALLLLFLGAASCSLLGSRGAPGDPIEFRTSDGFLLRGNVFGSGSRAVVLSHAFPGDQSSWLDFAKDLAEEDFLVITYDFRGYGQSQGRKDINLLDRDVRAAMRFLAEERNISEVALIGASMGGTASLKAAAESDVDAVITLSAPLEFRGLDASTSVSSVLAPKFFLASVEDGEAAESAKELLKLSRDPQAEIKLFPGDAHGTDMVSSRRAGEVRADILSFLKERL
jgi:pimeloyl-ACP methyl ester carboxylesterase